LSVLKAAIEANDEPPRMQADGVINNPLIDGGRQRAGIG
jgi:hypothetical protein